MKRFLFASLPLVMLAGCSRAPYKVLDRKVGTMGLVVDIRAEVPADSTKEQIESYCSAITQSEKSDSITNIEFIEDGPLVKQKAFCLGGQVTMISELENRAAR